jgi:hypothetical protein
VIPLRAFPAAGRSLVQLSRRRAAVGPPDGSSCDKRRKRLGETIWRRAPRNESRLRSASASERISDDRKKKRISVSRPRPRTHAAEGRAAAPNSVVL